jgi:hypothetical protein
VSYIVVRAWNYSSVCIVVTFGPCVVQEQWRCDIESRSVRGTRSVAVYLWFLVLDLYNCCGCVIVNRGSC